MRRKKPRSAGWVAFLFIIVIVGGAGSYHAPLSFLPGIYHFQPVACFACTLDGRRLRWYLVMCTTQTPGLYCWNCNALFPAPTPVDNWRAPEDWPGLGPLIVEWMRLYSRPMPASA